MISSMAFARLGLPAIIDRRQPEQDLYLFRPVYGGHSMSQLTGRRCPAMIAPGYPGIGWLGTTALLDGLQEPDRAARGAARRNQTKAGTRHPSLHEIEGHRRRRVASVAWVVGRVLVALKRREVRHQPGARSRRGYRSGHACDSWSLGVPNLRSRDQPNSKPTACLRPVRRPGPSTHALAKHGGLHSPLTRAI